MQAKAILASIQIQIESKVKS